MAVVKTTHKETLLGIGTLGLGNGSGALVSVGVITERNSIVIDNIQGSFNTGIGTIGFNNGSQVLGLDGTTGIRCYC